MNTLTIRRPDDWHVHLRDGALLQAVVAHTARPFARAIVMPNLRPPITTAAMGAAYRQRILDALRGSAGDAAAAAFTPLMTAYLTESIDPDELERGHHQFRCRGARPGPHPTGAGADGADRHAPADPRGGDRSGGGHL